MSTTINSSGGTSYQISFNSTTNDTSSTNGWDQQMVKTISNQISGPSGPSIGNSDDICGEPTLGDGTRCELDPTHEDDKCHWHTSEQCYRPTDDGSPCELPGSQPDGACHIHTSGCNEKLRHSAVEKACYHGLKYPYRMLGLHPDTKRSGGLIDIMPETAAKVAAEVGAGILQALDEEYNREESHEYYEDKIVTKVTDDESVIDKLKSKFDFGGEDDVALDVLKKGIKQMWKQVDDKENHADAARTAVAAAEFYLNAEVEVGS